MHHPDPTLFARRVTMQRAPDGRPQAIYRSNTLNPRAVWGLPVPILHGIYTPDHGMPDQTIADPTLIFNNISAPLRFYHPCLRATYHIPADAPYTQIDPTEGPEAILPAEVHEINYLRGLSGNLRSGGTGSLYHDKLLHDRNKLVLTMFQKRIERGMNVVQASTDVRTRMLIGKGVVAAIVEKAGYVFDKVKTRPNSKFSTLYEHQRKNSTLRKQVAAFRANLGPVHEEGGFHINDLYDERNPGGYPVECPVTGLRLDWDATQAHQSVRIIRPDYTQPVSATNVAVVSRLAKIFVKGKYTPTTVAHLVLALHTRENILTNIKRWAAENPYNEAARMVRDVEYIMQAPVDSRAFKGLPTLPQPSGTRFAPLVPVEPTPVPAPAPAPAIIARPPAPKFAPAPAPAPTPDTDAFNPFTLPAEGEPEPAWVTALNNVTAGLPKPKFAPDFTKKN